MPPSETHSRKPKQPALKLGFLPANRGFFDQTLAARMREEILNAAAKIGVELICPTPQQTRMGCVESLSESILCAELFAANRVDGILVSAVNFGDEQAVAQAIRRSGLSVPILLHACPEDGPLRIGGKRRDSFCGLLSIADALRQIGATYSIAADILANPNSESFRRDLAEFAAVCRVVRGIRTARYGQAGARPDAFWTCRYDERALQRLGPTTVTLDLSEIIARVNGVADETARESLSLMSTSANTNRTHTCENQRGIPGSGQVPWASFFKALHQVNYDGCVTIESFDPNMPNIAKLCCIWRKMADSPEQLATEGLAFLSEQERSVRSAA